MKGYHEVARGRDVSDFVAAVRNKGAHAAVILDVASSTVAAIETRQRAVGDRTVCSFEYAGGRSDYWPTAELLPGHGGFTVFYAAGENETTPELLLPKGASDQKRYGLFSFVVYSGILDQPAATARTIARTIDAYFS